MTASAVFVRNVILLFTAETYPLKESDSERHLDTTVISFPEDYLNVPFGYYLENGNHCFSRHYRNVLSLLYRTASGYPVILTTQKGKSI